MAADDAVPNLPFNRQHRDYPRTAGGAPADFLLLASRQQPTAYATDGAQRGPLPLTVTTEVAPKMASSLTSQADMLSGKTVILIHPPWHSCGSHTVFCTQAAAYMALEATVVSLAVGVRTRGSRAQRFWSDYYSMTTDLPVAERTHTGPSKASLLSPAGLKGAYRMLTSNYAAQLACRSELSPIPRTLTRNHRPHLIHCNHYFNIPIATRLKAKTGAPIILDTHDIQARQFEMSREASRFTGRRASFKEMLETELSFVRLADYLVHLNSDDHEFFRAHLPSHRHRLIYPAIDIPTTQQADNPYFLIVAARNYGNYASVAWFLDEVLPACPGITVKIAGTVLEYFAQRHPDLLRKYRPLFLGRVDNLPDLYSGASAILLPTIAGHGLSIKMLEALSTGLPIIAMPLAFRGISLSFVDFPNVQVATNTASFCQMIVAHHTAATLLPDNNEFANATSDRAALWRRTQRLNQKKAQIAFQRQFSFSTYKRSLAALAHELLAIPVDLPAAHAQRVNCNQFSRTYTATS